MTFGVLVLKTLGLLLRFFNLGAYLISLIIIGLIPIFVEMMYRSVSLAD